MLKFRDIGKGILNTFGALVVMQELISFENPVFFTKIIEEIEGDKLFFKTLGDFISHSQTNKLEEMRKI
jgi:hypothetical protein